MTAKPAIAKKPKSRRKSARGVLWVIALLLLSSGALRLGGPIGQAVASEVLALADGHEDAGMQASAGKTESDIALVLAQLKERETHLATREAALEDRFQALAIAETQIKTNLAALVTAEEDLAATMALADSAATEDLDRLTAMYENMKPKDAAPLFEAMDPQFAAGFLGRMRADSAAAIMSGLEPQTAYTISVILAGRNAGVPTN